jgi:hypothetical protein
VHSILVSSAYLVDRIRDVPVADVVSGVGKNGPTYLGRLGLAGCLPETSKNVEKIEKEL